MTVLREIGFIEISREQHQKWRHGELAKMWAQKFPELFDEDDIRLATRQGPLGYHLYEWLSAIVLHHLTGYFALVAKYEFGKHGRKKEVVGRLLDPDVIALLKDRKKYGHAQPPDLLIYSPDYSDWFFCEVKGPGDRLRDEQRKKFQALASLTGKPIQILTIRWAPKGRASRKNSVKASIDLT